MEHFEAGEVLWCEKCSTAGEKKGPIKPNVVFFNEGLPAAFHREAQRQALAKVDLLLIMGSTLRVRPFSLLPDRVPQETP